MKRCVYIAPAVIQPGWLFPQLPVSCVIDVISCVTIHAQNHSYAQYYIFLASLPCKISFFNFSLSFFRLLEVKFNMSALCLSIKAVSSLFWWLERDNFLVKRDDFRSTCVTLQSEEMHKTKSFVYDFVYKHCLFNIDLSSFSFIQS